ncbi:MAG: LamG-like jellyroll fold domain-containing protein, partial [Candidatus Poribacteria bacterium]
MKSNFKLIIAIVYLIAFGLLLPISWSAESELVLYFPLDEGKGNTVKGLSDHKHVGKFEGKPTWTDGKFGKALEFDGTSHVQIPLTKALESLTKDFTVEFWVKKSDKQAGPWNYMVAADRVRWAVIYNSDQSVYVWASNPGWSMQAKTKEPLPKEWTHIAVTFDTKDAVKIRF